MIIQLTNVHLNVFESDIQRLFTPYGEIQTVHILRDKVNNRSRGKAYVNMPVEKEAKQAILNLHGTLLAGKNIGVTALIDFEEGDKIMQGL